MNILSIILVCCIEWKAEVSIGDFITVIGLGVAIWQFSKQMEESRNAAKKLQKENWYLNIIVLPQLDQINTNYLNLIERVLTERQHLVQIANETNQKQFKRECAKIKRDIKKEISEQFDHIITLVRSYNNNLAQEVANNTLELEDLCIVFFDRYDEASEFLKIRGEILQNKENLISVLNKGLNTD